VLGLWFDLMILKVFSDLSCSMINLNSQRSTAELNMHLSTLVLLTFRPDISNPYT